MVFLMVLYQIKFSAQNWILHWKNMEQLFREKLFVARWYFKKSKYNFFLKIPVRIRTEHIIIVKYHNNININKDNLCNLLKLYALFHRLILIKQLLKIRKYLTNYFTIVWESYTKMKQVYMNCWFSDSCPWSTTITQYYKSKENKSECHPIHWISLWK